MKRLIIVIAAMAAMFVPATAGAIPIHVHHSKTIYKADPNGARHPVGEITWVEKIDVAPLDTDQDGIKDTADRCPDQAGDKAYNGCQPPVQQLAASTYEQPTYVPPAPTSGGTGCVGMGPESGSLGYANNTNPGYIGCYQISDDHYLPGHSCSGLGTDPAGQDACAQVICATEGPGAWTNPAGANPC